MVAVTEAVGRAAIPAIRVTLLGRRRWGLGGTPGEDQQRQIERSRCEPSAGDLNTNSGVVAELGIGLDTIETAGRGPRSRNRPPC